MPLVYGDVAFDRVRGGTIISSEDVMGFLAARLRPAWFLLAGDTAGVLDQRGEVVPLITRVNLEAIRPAWGGARGTDVTGGMAAKVLAMLELAEAQEGLAIRIFSGLVEGALERVLVRPEDGVGTVIRH
jgi:isopentenyl phosphate kinase